MKKLIVLVLMVMIGIGLFVVKAKADSSNYPYYNPLRTIVRQTIGATSNSVLVSHAVVVYKVSGYATSAAEIFGLYDTVVPSLKPLAKLNEDNPIPIRTARTKLNNNFFI